LVYNVSESSHDSIQSDGVKTVTICVPIFNEEETLSLLFARFNNLIEPIGYKFKYLFIDDGSYDSSRIMIKDYVSHNQNSGYIFLSRNFGKESAMMAAVDHVNSDAMVIVDADLQDPPELIPKMIDLWNNGYDDVYARRKSRSGDGWFKRITAQLYYKIVQSCTNISIQQDTGDFRLIDRKCILALREIREYNRNTKALFSWIGFRKIELRYDRDKRSSGKSKWTIPKLVKLAIDGITSFSIAPLRIST
jgi:glycosyltransferase involved in cell wall biosynthesis